MKTLHINEGRVTLAVASALPEFFGVSVQLPPKLADAILEEQKRKFELSDYLSRLREAGRAGTDPAAISLPSFLEVHDANKSTTQPPKKRGRPPRVPK